LFLYLDFVEDKSSRPHNIKTTLTPLEKELIRTVRRTTWMELDDLTDTVIGIIPNANRSNVYRTLKSFDINIVRLTLKECKEFFPFYLTHILRDNGLEFTDKCLTKINVIF
jgi:hypothetical protein